MVRTGELLASSQSSILLPKFCSQALIQGQHSLPCYKVCTSASTDRISWFPLKTRLDPFNRPIHLKRSSNRFSSVIRSTVVPEKVPTTLTVDLAGESTEIEPDNSGGDIGGVGGDGEGRDNNWGGGGGGNNNEGEGASDDSDQEPKPMAMSMSQKLTLGYAALVGIGGVMGYVKSGSQKSLISGGVSAALLYYVYTQLPTNPVFASSIGLGLSAALLAVMGSRFKSSGKIFPAGVVSFVSLIMTGGYLHGIMRGAH